MRIQTHRATEKITAVGSPVTGLDDVEMIIVGICSIVMVVDGDDADTPAADGDDDPLHLAAVTCWGGKACPCPYPRLLNKPPLQRLF